MYICTHADVFLSDAYHILVNDSFEGFFTFKKEYFTGWTVFKYEKKIKNIYNGIQQERL